MMVLVFAFLVIGGGLVSLYMMRNLVRLSPVDLLVLVYFVTLHIRFTEGRSGSEAFGAIQALKLVGWTAPALLMFVRDRRGQTNNLLPRGGAAAFALYLPLALLVGLLVGPVQQNVVGVVWLASAFLAARAMIFRHGLAGLSVMVATAICTQIVINGVFEIGIELAGFQAPPQLRSLIGTRRLIGLGVHANLVGRNAAILLLIAAFSPAFRRWPLSSRAPMLFTAGLVLLWSGSRSSIIAVVGTMAVIAVLRNAGSQGVALSGAGLALLTAFISNVSIAGLQSTYGRNGQADELTTLTGRTDVWAIAWREAWQRPLTGQGFAGGIDGLRELVEQETGLYWATHAHNWFLQTFYSTGLIGVGLMMMAAISVLLFAFRPGATAHFIGAIGIFTMIVGVTESPLGLLQTFLPALLWMGCLLAAGDLRSRPAPSSAARPLPLAALIERSQLQQMPTSVDQR